MKSFKQFVTESKISTHRAIYKDPHEDKITHSVEISAISDKQAEHKAKGMIFKNKQGENHVLHSVEKITKKKDDGIITLPSGGKT